MDEQKNDLFFVSIVFLFLLIRLSSNIVLIQCCMKRQQCFIICFDFELLYKILNCTVILSIWMLKGESEIPFDMLILRILFLHLVFYKICFISQLFILLISFNDQIMKLSWMQQALLLIIVIICRDYYKINFENEKVVR